MSHSVLSLCIQDLGVTINYYVWQCYDQKSSASFIWLFVIFVYLAALQIVGLVLAFQTRKVKVKVLNDSKYVAALVYISSIVLVVLALVTFTLGAYINVRELMFSGGVMVATTMLLVLIFVPKVRLFVCACVCENLCCMILVHRVLHEHESVASMSLTHE